ncbi:MAG: SDR family NAD(P)-dependent oxidoreductase [Chloroflexi bacterium]|nr:SDR family NAD(P)-dependent oxidoreductase [Chloroflexota bacterium]MCC6895149.1 SDR family NAD(P)-dependent oxidoreductase [Anaerolineae bacterium]
MTSPTIPSDKKVWFITGVSTGLGRTLTEAILEQGDTVAGTVRNTDQIPELEQLAPGRISVTRMDVTKTDEVKAAVDHVINTFGRIDVLVNNAGHGFIGAVEEVSDAEARALFDVNVFGVLAVLQAALPHMRARRSGTVVNMSSQGGVKSFPGSGWYCASKHALEALSESMSGELAASGIKVLIVEPSAFRTDFLGRSMVVAQNVIGDYANTSGQRRANLKNLDGKQKGDPVRAAKAIIKAVQSENPPLRLALGQEALNGIRDKVNGMLKDWSAWEAESVGADFPD